MLLGTLRGPQGTPGMPGRDGVDGKDGLPGMPGAPGSVGPQGLIGLTGPQGEQGIAGPQGVQGQEGATGDAGPIGPQGVKGTAGDPGVPGTPGIQGPQGPQGSPGTNGINGVDGAAGPQGPIGPIQTQSVVFLHPLMAASAVATNLAANVVNAVSDPNLRQFVDLRGLTKCRIHGRLGGSVNFATRIRLQYHVGGNIAVATGDAGWQILAESAGSHAVNTMFRSAESTIPVAAQIQNCIVRAVIFSGDGVADSTLTCVIADFTP